MIQSVKTIMFLSTCKFFISVCPLYYSYISSTRDVIVDVNVNEFDLNHALAFVEMNKLYVDRIIKRRVKKFQQCILPIC